MAVLTAEAIRSALGALEQLYVAPDIPPRKLGNARRVHSGHLPDGESILALYDDTAFGGAREGFVLTASRICWKNILTSPEHRDIAALVPAALAAEASCVRLDDEASIDVGMEPGLAGPLVALLRAAHAAPAPAAQATAPQQRVVGHRLAAFIRQRLSEGFEDLPVLHVAPDIPASKRDAVWQGYGALLPRSAPLVALYDDTVFGSGSEGFALTTSHIAWGAFLSEPTVLPWARLVPAEIRVTTGGIRVAGGVVRVIGHDTFLPALAAALRDITAAATVADRCTYCGVQLSDDDKRCPSCGAPV